MRVRLVAVILALAGLLVAVGVGLAANSIASRSFTPGVDALPSAGSLAPRAASQPTSPTAAPATTAPKPKPQPQPKPKPVTTAGPATTVDDHGGGGGGGGSGGKGSGGSGSSGSHGGGHGGDD
jgi:uncharacterized membrane protein YgcG